MLEAILVAILGTSFIIIVCAFSINTNFLMVQTRLDKVIDLLEK